jgi:DUF1680 family protein
VYRYVRSTATRFGFLPEVIGRKGDIVACETCAIMDYIGLAVTLANHGHPEYWGDVERVVRNHLIESQVADGSWLVSDPQREDTSQFSWHNIGERMVGGYAGWSSPTHILACKEELHWGGPEFKGKARAFQNCCGGSGTHAFFIAWKNATTFKDNQLTVNLHIDKLLPQAEIRCFQPYSGLLTISVKQSCRIRVRIPDFSDKADIQVEADNKTETITVFGNYIELGIRQKGEMISIGYPLPVIEDEELIGNPIGRKYKYKVTWKGDTVINLAPLGNEYEYGYSDFENREVPVYYGQNGPGRLYKRDHFEKDNIPELSELSLDCGGMNFWRNLDR